MSVQTDLDARVASLKGILDESNAALTDKGGEAAQNLSGLPAAIENLPTAELSDVYIVPTGKDFEVEPDEGTGFGTITVAGDMNLEPQNIAAGVVIYGVEGTLVPGATSSVPEEYQPYVDHALLLYTGEYENMAILEWNEHLAVMFLMGDFVITEYNADTTEFKAQGWVSCSFNKLNDNWTFTDWRDQPSTGGNYVMNIRYSSVYWEYGGEIIWPFGMSGGGGGGSLEGLENGYDVMFYDEHGDGLAFFSIKQGHSIEAPIYTCKAWKTEDGTNVAFPYTPAGDLVVYANNDSYASALYDFYGVDSVLYPYLCITYSVAYKNNVTLYFAQSMQRVNNKVIELSGVQYNYYDDYSGGLGNVDYTDVEAITAIVMAKISTLRTSSSYNVSGSSNALYTNFDTTLTEAPDLYRLD